jgi:hypothetical protein
VQLPFDDWTFEYFYHSFKHCKKKMSAGFLDLPEPLVIAIAAFGGVRTTAVLSATCRRTRSFLQEGFSEHLSRYAVLAEHGFATQLRLCTALDSVTSIPIRVGTLPPGETEHMKDILYGPDASQPDLLVADGDGTIAWAACAPHRSWEQHSGLCIHGSFAWVSQSVSDGTLFRYFSAVDANAVAAGDVLHKPLPRCDCRSVDVPLVSHVLRQRT